MTNDLLLIFFQHISGDNSYSCLYIINGKKQQKTTTRNVRLDYQWTLDNRNRIQEEYGSVHSNTEQETHQEMR